MAQYETNVKIPVFSGLMQYGDGIGVDLRYAVDAKNVETPGGVLQPMAASPVLPVALGLNTHGAPGLEPTEIVFGTEGPSGAVSLTAAFPGTIPAFALRLPPVLFPITSGQPYTITFWSTHAPMSVRVFSVSHASGLVLDCGAELFTGGDTYGALTQYTATVTATGSSVLAYLTITFADVDDPVTDVTLSTVSIGDKAFSLVVMDGLPVKIETLAVLHRRWYTGDDASSDVLVAAAGGVIYWMLPGGSAWTALAHPDGGAVAFESNTWSWVQYETAPATPEDDPIDVLILSNQDDGMIYIRVDDTAKTITKVATPKNFGVIARHNERIWGGDIAEDPDMVVYSAPYDFTDWAQNSEIPADGAGDIQQPTWDGDSFTALQQLGSHLIALRRNTVWRILGTDPGEWVWKQQYGGGTAYENTIAVDGERILMLGKRGLLQYDGLSVTPYKPENLVDFWATMNIAALEQSCACLYKGKYYLSVPTGTSVTNNAIVVYDTREQTWLLRTGLAVEAWLPTDSGLFFTTVSEPGCIALWGEDVWTSGTAATPCQWVSPWIDLGRKDIRKGGWQVYFTVESKAAGTLKISLETEKKLKSKTYSFSALSGHAKQKALSFGGSGRRFRLIIESTGTAAWRLVGGIQIVAEIDPD